MGTGRIKYVPRFAGAIQGHAVNTAWRFHRMLWRDHDMDDLLQEAYLVFLKCKRKYGPRPIARPGTVVDNPAWFMSLYSTALHNHFYTMTRAAGKYVVVEPIKDVDFAEDDNYLRQVLREHTEGIKDLMIQFLDGTKSEQSRAYIRLRKLFPAI